MIRFAVAVAVNNVVGRSRLGAVGRTPRGRRVDISTGWSLDHFDVAMLGV